MNAKEPFVITISREVGSGGHTVGQILSGKLNVRYCDKALIEALQEQFKLTPGEIERLKGEKKNWLADFLQFVSPMPPALVMGVNPSYKPVYRPEVTSDDLFKAETEILRELAQEGSCIIAGRSGFFVFGQHPNHLHVLVTASKANRVRRVMTKQGLTEEAAAALIEDIDTKRENYIKRYTGTSRYDARNYDLVINMDQLADEESAADIILQFIR